MQSLSYTVTGPNNVSATTNVTGSPFTASIPVTAEGITTIQYFGKDTLNNTEATQTFYVNIDKTAPVLSLPGNISVQADDANGKVVNFNATATDRAPASQNATCTPASGSTFAIGTTPVNCSATDDVGNTSTGSFNVEVTPAAQSITFDALDGKTYGDGDFTLGATASSGLDVSFAASGDCTITGNTVHITGAGSCTITASQAGNASYAAAESVQQSFNIAKAAADCSSIAGYSGTYDGQPHGATGGCTGVDAGGAATGSTLDLGASYTNAPGGTANWTFTGGANYADQSGSVNIAIGKADATCSISGVTVTYDGASHGATGSCTGVGGEATGGTLNLGASFTDYPGGTANWSLTGSTNYNDKSGSVAIVIDKADANVVVNGYSGTYDGQSHGATGTATGVGGADLSAGLNLGNSFTNAPGGTANWTFSGGTNYADESGSVAINIGKADATVSVSGYTGTYDGAAHGATGSATGVGGTDLSAQLNLGSSFTDAPGGTANWSFTGGTNYNDKSGSVAIVIDKADANCTVNGYSNVYDGAAHGASGSCTGVGGVALSGLSLGSSYTNVPGGTASWTFSGGNNYLDESGSVEITIGKANATINVTPYNVTYNGGAHTATGTATGVLSEALSGLDLSGTTHTDAGSYTDTWTFTDVTGNYNNAANTVNDVIAKAPVTATAGGGSSTYDGTTKSPSNCAVTGTYTGNLTCVNNPATVGPNANTYPINAVVNGTGQSNFNVTYVAGSYVIGKANAVISVTGYNVVFDGASHTATGTATGAAGENLSGLLNLSSTTHTLVGTYTNDPWSFAGDANHNSANGTVSSSIGSWTLRGFHQPVGISNTYGTLLTPSNLVWNTVKGGQTVPLKFNVFAGMLELTSTGNMTFGVTEVTCNASATALEDAVDFTTTGGTSLRYSGTPGVDGQFVQNWQTPATANKCYRVALTTWDGSKLVSYFKTKK